MVEQEITSHRSSFNGGFDGDVAVQHANQTTAYFYRNKMDFRRPSVRDCKHRPCDCYFVPHVLDAIDDAFVDLICVHWSLLLNGCHYETRWNDLLIVRCGFGDRLNDVLAVHYSDNDVTYYLDSR